MNANVGVDGGIYVVSAMSFADELLLEEKWHPFQVKQKDKAGRPNIDSFDYSSDALSEISRFSKQFGKVIIPLTVQEILDEQIAHKLV